MKTITEVKETESEQHPIRQHLGLTYDRWTAINSIVDKITTPSLTWGEILTDLSQNPDLVGVEYLLTGAIFCENMFRRIRMVPEGAGVSNSTRTPPAPNILQLRVVIFPTHQIVAMTGLAEDRLDPIRISVRSMPHTGKHLAEILSRIYLRHPNADPLTLVCGGFLGAAQTLIDGSMGDRYTIWNDKDPEWGTAEALS